MKRKSCEGCIYYRAYSGYNTNSSEKGCHFMYDTNEKRGCPVSECTRKKTGKVDARSNPFDVRLKK